MRIVLRVVLPLTIALWAGASAALAATPVSPTAGAAAPANPTFVAALAPGDTPLQVQVSTAPTGSDSGICFPSRDGDRASCTLTSPLKPGTYYWHLLYASNTNCVTVNSQRFCLPETHVTASVKFIVAGASPPPPPPPSSPPPPTSVPPVATQPTGPKSGTKTIARPTAGGTFGYTVP